LKPEEILQIKQLEGDLQFRLTKLGFDSLEKIQELNVRLLESVNATMQSESKAEKWPTYSWRPAVGFAFAFNLVQVSLVASVCYLAAIFGGKIEYLAKLPDFITAITALNATAMPILGVAAWFRGKMQADPNVPNLPKA
jgi:hypothetical protein